MLFKGERYNKTKKFNVVMLDDKVYLEVGLSIEIDKKLPIRYSLNFNTLKKNLSFDFNLAL